MKSTEGIGETFIATVGDSIKEVKALSALVVLDCTGVMI
jgi:hypothetical protein